jgi:hypothetical protein
VYPEKSMGRPVLEQVMAENIHIQGKIRSCPARLAGCGVILMSI